MNLYFALITYLKNNDTVSQNNPLKMTVCACSWNWFMHSSWCCSSSSVNFDTCMKHYSRTLLPACSLTPAPVTTSRLLQNLHRVSIPQLLLLTNEALTDLLHHLPQPPLLWCQPPTASIQIRAEHRTWGDKASSNTAPPTTPTHIQSTNQNSPLQNCFQWLMCVFYCSKCLWFLWKTPHK